MHDQIDYILCSEKIKHTLINARSFSGTETSSDHRLVIYKLQIEKYNIFKNIKQNTQQDLQHLPAYKLEEAKNYQQELHENLCKMECTSWENI